MIALHDSTVVYFAAVGGLAVGWLAEFVLHITKRRRRARAYTR